MLRNNEAAVRRGSLDVALDADVKGQHLNAPGRLTLSELELAAGGGLLGTFAGVPRQAVLAAMSRDGRIELAFTLEGRLDDQSSHSTNVRCALPWPGRGGISLGGVVEGLSSASRGLFGR
jgi:hypothetical protein